MSNPLPPRGRPTLPLREKYSSAGRVVCIYSVGCNMVEEARVITDGFTPAFRANSAFVITLMCKPKWEPSVNLV